ncbi:multifunctional CCA protein [bacterium BMS3Abin05]|nr:multifunctional CCA protein [bacterium BMS3Abin05]GBE28877.1 multifunctional CCA protein [bacterium BMS3Bbin03]HDL78998.1 HD domain-containing protein [Bacteroidota bacterium]HDZ11016.1 HD domain-containing protein [Bacteroidota bacterium]
MNTIDRTVKQISQLSQWHDISFLKKIGRVADEAHFEVYAVGGYVRDRFLTEKFRRVDRKDIDFVVVGDALEFARTLKKALHGRNLIVYRRFGTAMLEIEDYKLELVTARTESYADDSRKPTVQRADLFSDLSRRDFTINTLAIGLNSASFGNLYDPFDGLHDIKKKILRTPLEPDLTFKDDPLRILRAVRFAALLHFSIEEKTREAMAKMAPRLKILSWERITDEFLKILSADQPSRGIRLMDEIGLLPYVFPELIPLKGVEQRRGFHHKDVFLHTLKVLDNVAVATDKITLRFAALVHDIAKPQTKDFKEEVGWTFHGHDEIGARMVEPIASRMKLSNNFKKTVQKLVRLHLRPIFLSAEDVTDSAIRRLIVQAGDDLDDLFILCRADITSGNPEKVRNHLANFDYVVQRVEEVREKDKLREFQSPVRGGEIMEITGLKPGPRIGKLKKAIEEAILDGLIPNEHDAARAYLMQIKDRYLQEDNSLRSEKKKTRVNKKNAVF